MPIGGLLFGAKDEQVIPIGLGFDLRFAVLDSRVLFIDLAADLCVDLFFHSLPVLILAESGDYARRRVFPDTHPIAVGERGRRRFALFRQAALRQVLPAVD